MGAPGCPGLKPLLTGPFIGLHTLAMNLAGLEPGACLDPEQAAGSPGDLK